MNQEDHFPIKSLEPTYSIDLAIHMDNPSDFTWEDHIIADEYEK